MMKKSMAALAMAAGVSMAALPTSAAAQVSVDLEAAAVYNYAWRGFMLAEALVVQPSLTLGLGETGIALNIWGSAAITDRDLYEGADELDFTLSYDMPLGENAGLSVGYIQYTFPGLEEDNLSGETYASISFDNTLAPSILASYDFWLMEAFYASAGIGPEFAVGESATLGLGASVGVSNYAEEFGFNDVQASASLGLTLGGAAVTPFAGFSYGADKVNVDNSAYWAGVSVGFSF